MANEVKIILSAVDKASAVINKTDKSLDSLGKTSKFSVGSITELASGIAIAERVLKGAQQAIEQTVGVAVDYNKQIREMTQVTGLGAEEISRIVQVADDWGIEIGALRTSLGYMNKMGITPSIDNLAKLADEYVNSSDKAAFAEKAAKLLGRGYQTLIPLLAKGGDALRAQTAAVDKNLITTDKSIAAAREYEVALDNWNDSVLALQISIGNGLLPTLTAFINLANSPSADSAAAFMNTIFGGAFASDAWRAREAAAKLGQGIVDAAEAIRQADAAIKRIDPNLEKVFVIDAYIAADNMERLEREAMNAGEGLDDLGKSAAEAEPEVKGLLDGIDRDIASPIGNFIQDLKWYMAGGANIQTAFDNIKKAFDSGAITEPEADAYLKELYVAATDLSVELNQTDLDEAGRNLEDVLGGAAAKVAMDDIQGSQGIAGALERVTEVERKLVFRFVYLGTPPPGWGGGGWEGELAAPPQDIPKASGGPVSPNQLYMVGERGPELFVPNTAGNIVPNNQLQGGGGISFGDIIINAPAGVDANAVAALVIRRIQSGVIAASRSGAYAAGG